MPNGRLRASWWWIDRWRKSSAYTDMTLAQQGAYRNLLDELWLREGILPKDDRVLAKISGDALEWPAVRDVVMARFLETPEGWRNVTHDEVADQCSAFIERQREKGRARAAAALRAGGKFQPINQPANQPDYQPKAPAENQPSVLRTPSPLTDTVSDSETETEKSPSDSVSALRTPRAKKPREHSPAELLARNLSQKLGASLNPCRKSIQALHAAKLDDIAIQNALESLAEPGMAPWDFTKLAAKSVKPSDLELFNAIGTPDFDRLSKLSEPRNPR